MPRPDAPEPSGRRATLRDVAAAAGVHVSTASRALARARSGQSPLTLSAARVVEIATAQGYEPDPIASGLRTRRTHVLGVLVPRLTDLAVSTMYEGLDAAAAELGYQTFVGDTLDAPDERRRRAQALLARRVDGLILGDARIDDDHLPELARQGVPFVLMNRRRAPWDSVTCDDRLGGRMAGRHLAELGHRSIGVLAGQPYASTGLDRTHGCLEALAEHGVHVPPEQVVPCEFSPQGGRDAMMTLMSRRDRPTAVFAVTDIVAIGAMGALRDLELTVGSDVAIIGFNDISLAKELVVPLSSVRSQLATMGSQAARMLVDRIGTGGAHSSTPHDVRLPPELVVRRSSDPSATS